MLRTIKNLYHFFEALLANIIYGFPGKKLRVVGVTGTDGKTTTVTLIYAIFRRAGLKAAMITTIESKINDAKLDLEFHGTTPSAFVIQKFLYDAAIAGATDVVLEVSSHGLDQFRVWGVPFEIGVLTNITHEHFDYHGTLARYIEAKLKLFKRAKIAVLNLDDKAHTMFMEKLHSKTIRSYSLRNSTADYTPAKFPFKTCLFGEFNLENCLAAISAAKALGIDDEIIRSTLKEFKAPAGREEIVYDQDFTVMIDFAHTPNALEKLLSEISKMPRVHRGRIIHIFSATGRRDPSKRPLMGEASAKYAQVIILTAEDPRDENVSDINAQIKKGIPPTFALLSPDVAAGKKGSQLLFEIPDREKAIEFGVAIAEPGDFLVITGKGHEREMYVRGGAVPFDEKEIIQQALIARAFKNP